MKYSVQGVNTDSIASSYTFTPKSDGKDYPVAGSMPGGADSITVKKIDANH